MYILSTSRNVKIVELQLTILESSERKTNDAGDTRHSSSVRWLPTRYSAVPPTDVSLSSEVEEQRTPRV